MARSGGGWHHQLHLLILFTVPLVGVQALLVWLLFGYQDGEVQEFTQHATTETSAKIKRRLNDGYQELQTVAWQELDPDRWHAAAVRWVNAQRHIRHIEKRDENEQVVDAVASPYDDGPFDAHPRVGARTESLEACREAKLNGVATYSRTYFVPLGGRFGVEVMDLCIAERVQGKTSGYIVATLDLGRMLESTLQELKYERGLEVSFMQEDSRLVRAGDGPGNPKFRAEQIISIPGQDLKLRIENTRRGRSLELNIATGMWMMLNLAIVGIIALLARSFRHAEQQRKQEERYQAAMRLSTLGEMSSLISHEMNQPLLAVTMYADAALQSAEGAVPQDVMDLLNKIAREVARASGVVKSVQGFVRRGDVVREVVSVTDLVGTIEPLIRLDADRKSTQLQVDLRFAPSEVVCERVMIEQVLLNLARNALQAMAQSTAADARRLRITVRPSATGRCKFIVTDTGPGVPDSVAQQIDHPFKKSTTEGMGLGLSFCRSVIEKHGGMLKTRSLLAKDGSARAVGAEFAFTLAIGPEGPEASQQKGRLRWPVSQ